MGYNYNSFSWARGYQATHLLSRHNVKEEVKINSPKRNGRTIEKWAERKFGLHINKNGIDHTKDGKLIEVKSCRERVRDQGTLRFGRFWLKSTQQETLEKFSGKYLFVVTDRYNRPVVWKFMDASEARKRSGIKSKDKCVSWKRIFREYQ